MSQDEVWISKFVKMVLTVCLLLLLSPKQSFTQETIPGVLYLEALSEEVIAAENWIIQNDSLYNLLQQYGMFSYEQAALLAQNILQTADTLTYKESYILPTEGAKTGKVRRRRVSRDYDNDRLKVYPNPAKEYVIVEYQLIGDTDKVVVKLIDNNGFIRQTIVQENNHGFTVIDTRGLETGTYIAHIAANGKLVGVGKFVIVH